MTRKRSASRLLMICAALLVAMTGIGCGEDDEEIPEQLVRRQWLLDDAINHQFANPPETPTTDCTVRLTAGSDPDGDAQLIRKAVAAAESWDVICLEPGTFAMGMNDGSPTPGNISISSTANLTIKGLGENVDDVVLDYDGQLDQKGFLVTAPGFWIENMWIRNTANNGVEVKATNAEDNPNVFRKLLVTWDAGSVTENGAYSIYPTTSAWVIVEFSEVVGASDAGLYIGQVDHAIVRNNYVHGNVAGLEVENSYDVTVLGNAVTDNTAGILALQEPFPQRLRNETVLVRNNEVWANNRANFANPISTVANVPPGVGLMSFAGTDIEFRNNTVYENETTGLLIVSNVLFDELDGETAPFIYPAGYDPYATYTYNNENWYSDNGTDPDPLVHFALGFPPLPIADVIWDGYISDGEEAGSLVGLDTEGEPIIDPVPEVFDPQICLGSEETPSFDILNLRDDPKWDDLDFTCDLPELPDTLFP